MFLVFFGGEEEWRLFGASELHGSFLSGSVLHEDSTYAVSSSKSILLDQKGATVCLRSVFVEKEEE